MAKVFHRYGIIQLLRVARQPLLAAQIAGTLKTTMQRVNIDVAALKTLGMPISGDKYQGYQLDLTAKLPPINFTLAEVDDIVGRKFELANLAVAVPAKSLATIVLPKQSPPKSQSQLVKTTSKSLQSFLPFSIEMVRQAIRDEQKIQISYGDVDYQKTKRTIWPVAIIHRKKTQNIAAWCELRKDIRNFRIDRVLGARLLDQWFKGESAGLLELMEGEWD